MTGVYWKAHTNEVLGKHYTLDKRHDIIKGVNHLLTSPEETDDT